MSLPMWVYYVSMGVAVTAAWTHGFIKGRYGRGADRAR